MPKCPQCDEEISELRYEYTVSYSCIFDVDGASDADDHGIVDDAYVCDHCGECIATTSEDALKFLRGERHA